MASSTVRVKGLRELQRDFKRMEGGLNKEVDKALKDAADIVSQDARQRFSSIDARSAAGFRPRVKGFGRAFVEQRRRRTTGKHPEYGALQMRRALLPALNAKQGEVIEKLDDMLARLGGDHGF